MTCHKTTITALAMGVLVASATSNDVSAFWWGNPANDASDELTSIYIDAGIYKPAVRCEEAEHQQRWYIFCHHPNRDIGGLFLFDEKNTSDEMIVVYTVNGKARQHLGTAGINVSCRENAKPVVVDAQLSQKKVKLDCAPSPLSHNITDILKAFD